MERRIKFRGEVDGCFWCRRVRSGSLNDGTLITGTYIETPWMNELERKNCPPKRRIMYDFKVKDEWGRIIYGGGSYRVKPESVVQFATVDQNGAELYERDEVINSQNGQKYTIELRAVAVSENGDLLEESQIRTQTTRVPREDDAKILPEYYERPGEDPPPPIDDSEILRRLGIR